MTDKPDPTTHTGEHPAPPDPATFPSGDDIDSAAIVEADDTYTAPADPQAEPVEDVPGGAA